MQTHQKSIFFLGATIQHLQCMYSIYFRILDRRWKWNQQDFSIVIAHLVPRIHAVHLHEAEHVVCIEHPPLFSTADGSFWREQAVRYSAWCSNTCLFCCRCGGAGYACFVISGAITVRLEDGRTCPMLSCSKVCSLWLQRFFRKKVLIEHQILTAVVLTCLQQALRSVSVRLFAQQLEVAWFQWGFLGTMTSWFGIWCFSCFQPKVLEGSESKGDIAKSRLPCTCRLLRSWLPSTCAATLSVLTKTFATHHRNN